VERLAQAMDRLSPPDRGPVAPPPLASAARVLAFALASLPAQDDPKALWTEGASLLTVWVRSAAQHPQAWTEEPAIHWAASAAAMALHTAHGASADERGKWQAIVRDTVEVTGQDDTRSAWKNGDAIQWVATAAAYALDPAHGASADERGKWLSLLEAVIAATDGNIAAWQVETGPGQAGPPGCGGAAPGAGAGAPRETEAILGPHAAGGRGPQRAAVLGEWG